ncbi:hypothetical protein HS7_08260 [Sulfolobales archaeon HS-7]|nr:hypothetical protein HS7_08260 [Sulfolobales archaeon HS-7]
MRREVYLILAILVILLTLGGVYLASSYRTNITYSQVGSSSVDGKYVLYVKIIMNYGPFGGSSPLDDAEIWIYHNGMFYSQGYTNGSGVVQFTLPPGTYTVRILPLRMEENISLNGDCVLTVNYAYLHS